MEDYVNITDVAFPFSNTTDGLYNNSSYSNSSNIELDSDGGFKETKRIIFLVVNAVYIVFGTFGNVLIFIVMRRGSLKDMSTCFYMSILALADTG